MGDNRYTGRSSEYRGDSRQKRDRVYAASPTVNLGEFPWQLFVAVAFAVIGIVIFSVAVTMLTGRNKNNQNTGSGAQLYVSDSTAQGDTVIAFDDTDDTDTSSEDLTALQKADFTGTWQKTDVYETEKAMLTVTDQNDIGFSFTMKIWNAKKTASISGTAYFTGSDSAAYTKGLGLITFTRGTQYMSVYHTGNNSELGISDSFKIDGKYTVGVPNYYKTAETGGYDYNVYKSETVVKALSATLSADDYALYKEMMSEGLQSPIAYERTVDKNGKKVNVDAELNCVKYYAHLNSIGEDMVFICSHNGKIYVLFYDSEQMRYYTNDKNYSKKMPNAFQAVADAKGMKPKYVYR